VAKLDHLLLGVDDLDRGIAWFADLTGVSAAVGGSHPGRGTRNALAALGGGQYLEIIAPDPAQPPGNLRMPLRTLTGPRLITWCASTPDIDVLARRVRERGDGDAAPQAGSRSRPDGTLLEWRTLPTATDFAQAEVDPVPFFIEWAPGSLHPSEDAPRGCQLMAFQIEHPDSDRLSQRLAALDLDVDVRRARDVRLVATLSTPKGRSVLA